MKYKAIQNYSRDVYRDCVLVDLNEYVINIGSPTEQDRIIDPDKLPEGIICCDSNIAAAVLMLNKKGYKTLYSCGGHFDENIDENGNNNLIAPYIMFEADRNIEKYAFQLITLPRQLSVRIDSSLLPTVKEEMEAAYGRIRKPGDTRISIYSDLVYGFRDDSDFVEPNYVTREMFEKYNNQDIKDIMSWINYLPNLRKNKTIKEERK